MFDKTYASSILDIIKSNFENGEKLSIVSIPELDTFLKCSEARGLFREKGIAMFVFFWSSRMFSKQITSPYMFVFVRNPISWFFWDQLFLFINL